MSVTYDKFIEEVKVGVSLALSTLERVSIKKFLSSKDTSGGVYFVFDADRDLVYIGRGASVRGRILNHLSPSAKSGILFYVCRDLGIRSGRSAGHQCRCGRLTECSNGKHHMKVPKEASEIAARIKGTYTIAVMSEGAARGRWAIESMMADILKPKYGFNTEE